MSIKKFDQSDNTAVFTTKFVIQDKKDITTVYHFKSDSNWQFSSSDEFDDFMEIAKIVCLGEIIELDSTVLEIADMPEGFFAFRKSKGDSWEIKEFQEK